MSFHPFLHDIAGALQAVLKTYYILFIYCCCPYFNFISVCMFNTFRVILMGQVRECLKLFQ